MAHNRAAMEMLIATPAHDKAVYDLPRSRWIHLRARLIAHRLDAEIERGTSLQPASALAVHTARITSPTEREALARSLRSLIQQARAADSSRTLRVPIDRRAVLACDSLLEQIADHLRAPEPVRARGIARLRLILSDGCGPLYRPGPGSLGAQLRGVLAAL